MVRPLKVLLVVLILVCALGATVQAQDDMPVIGFMQFVSHPALDAGREGAVKVLNDYGYIDGETATFLFANGEGDIPTLTTIAQNFVDQDVDMIIATSTPALQAAYNVTKDLEGPPLVFNVVTSPYAAGVATAPCQHPAWVIGTQALAPYDQTVPLIFDIVPDADTVGYIYNSAEANSVANTEIITPIMADLGLKMEIQSIAASSEVATAAEALVSKNVDVFYVATDSTVVAGLEALIGVANENGIPVIASDPSSAVRGAIVAQGLDYMQEGYDAGRIAVAILQGELDIASAKINRQLTNLLAVNLDAADTLGITIPETVMARAGIVVENGEQAMAAMVEMTDEEKAAADEAFMQALICTEEEMMAVTEAPAS